MATDRKQAYSSAKIASTWVITGDFDVQVDFKIGEGWKSPIKDHLDGAFFGVNIAGQSYHITRLRSSIEDKFFTWSTTGPLIGEMYTNALSGKYRLIRAGTSLILLFDFGTGWRKLASTTVPSSPAQVYFGNGSINASQAFTTYFDNFHISSGLATYRP